VKNAGNQTVLVTIENTETFLKTLFTLKTLRHFSKHYLTFHIKSFKFGMRWR